jgi:acyl carrier protein
MAPAATSGGRRPRKKGHPMSSDPEVTSRILAVIAGSRRMPVELVTLDKTFEDLNMDSLDGINLVFELENTFHIDVPDEAARQIRSVREIVEGVEQLLDGKSDHAVLGGD